MTQRDFLVEYCQIVDQCHGEIPDRLWFSTWMASKSPYFDFPSDFSSYWAEGRWPKTPGPFTKFYRIVRLFLVATLFVMRGFYARLALRRELAAFYRKAGHRGIHVLRTFSFRP